VKWRVALPEPGNSTPIVWGEKVFLTQAVGDRRTLMCFNRADGKLMWQQGVTTAEKEPTHGTNPYASQSPVTDGERVIAAFASDGLYCYDLDGKLLWNRTDLGKQIHIWGAGTSPVIHGDLCILNFGPGETTYLIALDKKTGQMVWKHEEETGYGKAPTAADGEKPKGGQTYIGSWSTPVMMKVDGQEQLLVSWPRRLAAYDPVTGRELWTCAGLTPLVYTSPIHGEGIIVTMSGFGGSAMAVRAGGAGDVTSTHRVWHQARSPQRIGSGVVHKGRVYIHNDPGTATCLDLKSGELIWQERLRGVAASGQNWSSVLLSGDKCYTINQGGDCFVFRAGPKFELLATNPLGERSNSSIVPSNGELFIRTHKSLWCIAEKR
jgi:outer membrane protein assembly factor BamB